MITLPRYILEKVDGVWEIYDTQEIVVIAVPQDLTKEQYLDLIKQLN